MAAEDRNRIEAPPQAPRTRAGDLPDHLARRYFTDGRGGPGVGYYADATGRTPAFRDIGWRLTTIRNDPHVIRDLVAIAGHRGWTTLVVRGEANFRREVWLQASARGLEVRGYAPTPRDLQALQRRPGPRPRAPGRQGSPLSPEARLDIAAAVVRGRVADPPARDRILGRAREQVERWLRRPPAPERKDAAPASRSRQR